MLESEYTRISRISSSPVVEEDRRSIFHVEQYINPKISKDMFESGMLWYRHIIEKFQTYSVYIYIYIYICVCVCVCVCV